MAKKTNPRRIPATWADVERARQDGIDEAIKHCWAIFFNVLMDKEHAEIDDLIRVWKEVDELSHSVEQGYVTIADLIYTLKTEVGIDLK